MGNCKSEYFSQAIRAVERPTNIRNISKVLGISEITVTKYIAVMSAKGELRTIKLGRMVIVL